MSKTSGGTWLLVLGLVACKQPAAPAPSSAPAAAPTPPPANPEPTAAELAMFAALPTTVESKEPLTEARIKLGRQLFYEKRLSKGQDISCNSCHSLGQHGVDGKPTSTGHKGQLGGRNSPTVMNAAGHFVQFWDGRAVDVEAQAAGPMTNPVEMAMPDAAAVAVMLKSIPDYAPAFKDAFPDEKDPITLANAARAIGAFERKLLTPGRWDKYLAGDKTALTADEKKGFKTFMEAGCMACHNGAYVGGSMYQKLGLVKPYPDQKDQGRFEITKQDADKMMFKVPSLRNVEKTAPYFHTGKVATLPEAVKQMGEYQLGKALTDAQVASIVTWLKALTGEVDAAYIAEPAPFASGKKTPKPDLK